MAEKPPAEKLELKPGMSAAILFAPEDVDLGVADDVTTGVDPDEADFILLFASDQLHAEERIRAVAPSIRATTVTWIAYPKGSKAKGLDISRDTIGRFVPSVGLVVNANFAIDDIWSAVRVRPLKPGEKSPYA
jgi:hypothetical protein